MVVDDDDDNDDGRCGCVDESDDDDDDDGGDDLDASDDDDEDEANKIRSVHAGQRCLSLLSKRWLQKDQDDDENDMIVMKIMLTKFIIIML